MALSPEPTLADLTGELLTLIGQGGTGVASASMSARAEAAIRRAQKVVNLEADWTINRRRLSIALDANATEFDWPDDTAPGYIENVSAIRVSDPRYEWDLVGGITSEDRSSWNFGGLSTMQDVPFKYSLHDGVIEVGPASSSATTIYMAYVVGSANLVNPDDRPNCDGEAVLRKAEVILRNQLGGSYSDAIPACEAEYQRYLNLLRPRQGEETTMVPGSEWAYDDMSQRSQRGNQQRHWMLRDRRP